VIPISILTQKSLPSLPTPIPVLAVASSTHLRAFIHNALVEEGFVYDDHSDNSGEDWTEEIASAFEGLGRAIQSGEWLAGFRRARQALQDEVEKGSGSATKEEKDPNAKQSIQESAIRPPTVAEEQRLSQVMTKAPPTALSEEDPNTGHTEQVLLQMGELLARTPGQVPEDSAKHLLLVVTPFAGGLSYTRQDVDMDYVSSSFGCSFSLGVFNLTAEGRVDGTLLYGLDNWKGEKWYALYLFREADNSTESYTSLSDGLQIVGGTFALNGVLSKPRYEALCRTLRMSLFMFMSILIEQQVLRDFHAPLKYPSPPPTPLPQTPLPVVTKTPEPMAPPTSTTPTPTLKASTRMRGASSNLWSYITKKRDNLFARAADSFPLSLPVPAPRGGSLDLRPSPSLSPFNPERPAELNPTGPRRRTTSLLGLLTPTIAVRPEPTPPVFNPPAEEIFTAALARLQANASLLSTTPGTAFAPPLLLARLAEDPQHRVTGDEATALRSLAGWVGADRLSRAKELSAVVPGFVRHQTFVALYSEHVPVPIDPPESRNGTLKSSPTPAPSDAGTATASTMISPTSGLSAHAAASGASEATAQSSSCMEEKNALLAQCTERRRVVNFRYYAPGDQRLGESVVQWCNEARELCRRPKCRFTKGEHELRWIHGGVRIALQKHFEDEPEYSLEAVMRAWIRCKICGKETEPQVASSGTQ
jgi:1-phosphatidylinositol-3-phosphate 5-kinase